MDFDDSIMDEFVVESRDHLDNIEEDILRLFEHKDDSGRETVDGIFRAIHSIKGAAGFLRLTGIERLAHVMETLLSNLRSERIEAGREIVDALLEGVDQLNKMLGNIGKSNEFDTSRTETRLNSLMGPEGPETGEEAGSRCRLAISVPCETGVAFGFEINALVLRNLPPDHKFLYILKYDLAELCKEKGKSPVRLVRELLEHGEIVDAKIRPPSDSLYEGLPVGPLMYFLLYSTYLGRDVAELKLNLFHGDIVEIDRERLISENKPADAAEKEIPWISLGDEEPGEDGRKVGKNGKTEDTNNVGREEEPETTETQADPGIREEFFRSRQQDIRIDLEKLDHLVNLVGELVIAESMVTQNADIEGLELENFEHSARGLRRIISELQDVAMSMRMVPLSQTFRKMSRIVHDVSSRIGKKCKLELLGQETELDKRVIEQITDPLLHIVRNCLDHGIETPEERTAKNKPETGTIRIEARHQGGEVMIRISDNGRGLNREKILDRAGQLGLDTKNDSEISEKEVLGLIFEPGLSTSETVTDISGRGVGLDVVRGNIQNLKGRVDLRSEPGKGTAITLRIPLTMAIIDGMLVRVGSASYTIPMLSIRQSFRPSPEQVTVTMDGQEIVRVRDDLIPVVRLHKLYNIVPERTELDRGILINVASGGQSVCLFADEIIGHHQTVIKGMPNYVSAAKGISGCTIMTDGEVSLILDIGRIIDISENENEHS